MASDQELADLLAAAQAGDAGALRQLLDAIHRELRALARRHMAGERANHTLQPTALVHEAYLRLLREPEPWQNRSQFLALAARAMRQILVEHARARMAQKRSAAAAAPQPGRTSDADTDKDGVDHYLVALDRALDRLHRFDAELARVVELKFFGGLSVCEVAESLGVSERTVKRHWNCAKAWLHAEITRECQS